MSLHEGGIRTLAWHGCAVLRCVNPAVPINSMKAAEASAAGLDAVTDDGASVVPTHSWRVRVYVARLPGSWTTADQDDWLRSDVAELMLELDSVRNWNEMLEMLRALFLGIGLQMDFQNLFSLDDFASDDTRWSICQHVVLMICDDDSVARVHNPQRPVWLPGRWGSEVTETARLTSTLRFDADVCRDFEEQTKTCCTLLAENCMSASLVRHA